MVPLAPGSARVCVVVEDRATPVDLGLVRTGLVLTNRIEKVV